MSHVPAGGPSTINGVLYQILWSLVTLGGFRVIDSQLVNGEIENITLILEPSTGGDQQAVFESRRVVTQIKARSTDDAWSLQDIIREVLPNLYLAVETTSLKTEYQFVTEGRHGNWASVEDFFRTLPPPPPGSDLLSHLPDAGELNFGADRRQRSRNGNHFGRLGRILRGN